jgi:hypothetical protein
MYLKNDRIIVTLKNINFRTSRTSSTIGQFVLDPTALTGWDDGVNSRRDATVRPVSAGDFTEPYTFSSRLISLSGAAVATSRGELQRMRDQFVSLLGESEYAEIRVETTASVRYAVVGLENSPSFVQQLDNVAYFRLELYAPDPHIYGAERIVTIGATVEAGGGLSYPLQYPLNYNVQNLYDFSPGMTNNGNATAWPRFKVTGDYYSGFTLTDGKDRRVTYNGIVTRNSPVEIDMKKGTAMQNGVDKSTLLSSRQWINILAGETIKPEFLPTQSASGWCDIIVRDTFI